MIVRPIEFVHEDRGKNQNAERNIEAKRDCKEFTSGRNFFIIDTISYIGAAIREHMV